MEQRRANGRLTVVAVVSRRAVFKGRQSTQERADVYGRGLQKKLGLGAVFCRGSKGGSRNRMVA